MNKNIILIREQTGCPYMIIKKALWTANDNVDEAIKLLRENMVLEIVLKFILKIGK